MFSVNIAQYDHDTSSNIYYNPKNYCQNYDLELN